MLWVLRRGLHGRRYGVKVGGDGESSAVAGHLNVMLVDHPGQEDDVLHGIGQDHYFGDLLDVGSARKMLLQGGKPSVHRLNSASFPSVPLDSLGVPLCVCRVPLHRRHPGVASHCCRGILSCD